MADIIQPSDNVVATAIAVAAKTIDRFVIDLEDDNGEERAKKRAETIGKLANLILQQITDLKSLKS